MLHLAWWSEGEVGAEQIYRQSFAGFFVALATSAAILVLFPGARSWYILIICVCVTARALLERRRAFIFTDSAVVYRPAFGSPVRIEFADISSIEKGTAPVSFWLRTRLFKGLRVHLKNIEDVVLPLDFPQAQVISQQLLKHSDRTRPEIRFGT
jgi:hypothetical protein